MQLSVTARRAGAIAALALLVSAEPARADEVTGTWTGDVEIQGNYYWETSTRVVAPEVNLRLESPEGTYMRVGYLVDAITSASIAAGVNTDIRFTETRNQVTAGLGREFDLGDMQLQLDVTGLVSHEPDYLATNVGVRGRLSLFERCTVLGLSLIYVHDSVGRVVRGDPGSMGADLSDRGRQGQLEGVALGLSWEQILTPQLLFVAGYDLAYNEGYLANAYRRLQALNNRFETHPQDRARQSAWGRLALFVPETRTSIQGIFRAYIDDWDLAAITPELRVYQEISELVTVRVRWRYYAQTRSYFAFTQDRYSPEDPFITNDPKMFPFDSHMIGVHTRLTLGFLADTPFDFLHGGEIWVSFDHWFQTSRFGNGVLAQAAVAVPF